MVSTGYFPILPQRVGAIEPYVYELSKNLSFTSVVDVFGTGRGEETLGNLHVKAFPCKDSGMLKKIAGIKLAHQIPFNIHLLNSVFYLNKENPIDIIHIHDAYSGFLAAIGKLGLGIPCVCSIHNEIRITSSIQACDKILPVSEYIKDFLITKKKVNPNKLELLRLAIQSDYFCPKGTIKAKDELGLTGKKVVVFVGRKCPEKGPQILISALPIILKKFPNTLAIFIGPDYSFINSTSSYTDFLRRKAIALGVEKQIVFKGFLPDDTLKLYYNAADVCVFPSIWQEPFGIVILEALALQKPVVASRAGGIPEVIINEKTGLLVNPGDSKELANSVIRLLSDPDFALKLGANGRNLVEEQFNFKVVSSRCFEIYKKVLCR